MWYRMMGGGRITLKSHVVPHIFNKKSADSQLPATDKKLKRENGLFDEEIQIKTETPEYDSLQDIYPGVWTNIKHSVDVNTETSLASIKVKEEIHDWSDTELNVSAPS